MSQDVPAPNSFESFANESRSMVERRDDLDLRIMNLGGLDLHESSRRQSAEEIHDSSAAHHGQSLFPRGRVPRSLDDRIGAALIFSEFLHGGHQIGNAADIDGSRRAQTPRKIE